MQSQDESTVSAESLAAAEEWHRRYYGYAAGPRADSLTRSIARLLREQEVKSANHHRATLLRCAAFLDRCAGIFTIVGDTALRDECRSLVSAIRDPIEGAKRSLGNAPCPACVGRPNPELTPFYVHARGPHAGECSTCDGTGEGRVTP